MIINLVNVKWLIDDCWVLIEKEIFVCGGKCCRFVFVEEEEGYMFVEEGFCICFNNGEVIDFYVDIVEDKDSWMKVLFDVIGCGDSLDDEVNGVCFCVKWCEFVFKWEE